jgi:hypothetical protein
MNGIDDGGAAFPVQKYEGSWIEGASLRDYFAAKAMLGILTEPISGSQSLAQYLTETAPGDAESKGARFARAAYAMADAMLVARSA